MFRIRLGYAFFALFFCLITIRLFYWQIIHGATLRAQAVTQYFQNITLPAHRGSIVSSDGSPIVINQPAFLVYAKPPEIPNKVDFIQKVSSISGVQLNDLLLQLEVPGRLWVPIAKKIDTHTKNIFQSNNISGLGFEREMKRAYPESSMAAQLLGFVGQNDEGLDTGYFGIEGYYDRHLRGKDGSLSLERDPSGTRILLNDATRVEPENGRTLVLWLDKTIQSIVERHLASAIQKYGAKEGSVIVMDPQSGGILAMASIPSYSPNDYQNFDSSLFKNPIVASSYEPGSTFKVLVMAKALDLQVISPQTLLNESGPIKIGGYTIKTWNDQYNGSITATHALTTSSNVGMVEIGSKIGKDQLLDLINDLGFGQLTNIDLQDEASPDIRTSSDWTEIDLATLTFGQGIAVTPIQMVRAVASIANGGWLMEPKVVKSVREESGKTVDIAPKKIRQVYRKATTSVLTEMMVTAVENGEAKWAKPKGYRIAGKTGTAQIPVEGHYDDEKTIASFVGFAPHTDPRFVMLVTLREPTSSPWGSETAAPLFFTISGDLFVYLGIPPS